VITDEAKSVLRLLSQGSIVTADLSLELLLKKLGLDYQIDSANGLSLRRELSLLNYAVIESLIGPDASLNLLWEVDSTNRYVIDSLQPGQTQVCTAEAQTAGRGRRGKHWISPFARNIYLSVGKVLAVKMADLTGLSLVVGMEIGRLLRDKGCSSVGLKWPNDLLTAEGKLGGILVELGHPGPEGIPVCVGIGLNVASNNQGYDLVDQDVSFLSDYMVVDRSVLVGEMANKIIVAMENHGLQSMDDYQRTWKNLNRFDGCKVQVSAAGKKIEGIDAGIDSHGRLILHTSSGVQYCIAGEVSVRAVDVE
jgi:BirA family biotin operon repressor/biotin-[acetyl-CoA-carboxylase] ligase